MESRSKQKEELDIGQQQTKERAVLQEIAAAKKSLEESVVQHREEEVSMRKKKRKIENEVEAWINKYDADMEEKQQEVDEVRVSKLTINQWFKFKW